MKQNGPDQRNHDRDAGILRLAQRCKDENKFMPKLDEMASHLGVSRDRMKVIMKRLRQEGRLVSTTVRKEGYRGGRVLVTEVRQ